VENEDDRETGCAHDRTVPGGSLPRRDERVME
jgi:hypothetical protein